MSRGVAARVMALALIWVLAGCVFSPDLSRFAPCDERGVCAPGTTCLASEGLCLPDCGAQGPCEPGGTPGEADAGGGAATDGGDAGTPDAGTPDAGSNALRLAGPGILADFPSGKDYDEQLSAVGGQPPYSFELVPGNTMPSGLVLSSNGHVQGSTNATTDNNPYSFEARVTDSAQPPHVASRSLYLTPSKCVPGTTCLRTRSAPDARVGQLYDYGLQANTRSMSSVTWAVDSGQLPPGIELTSTGRLSGTPTMSGRYTFVLSLSEVLTPTPVKSSPLLLDVF